MVYYATADEDLILKDVSKIKELKLKLESISEDNRYAESAIIDPTGHIYFDSGDWNYNLEEELEFVNLIAPYMSDYSTLAFSGEENCHWRHIFKEGKAHSQHGTLIYGSIAENFLEHYKTELPAQIKKHLKSWVLARKI